MKTCFKCGKEKPLCEFYKHAQMADGHLNKCKSCAKADVKQNYSANREHYQEYERGRAMLSHRVEARKEYQKAHPEVFRRLRKEYEKRHPERVILSHQLWIESNPEKRKAHNIVNNALRDGKLIKYPCRDCGNTDSEAHHDDYSRPLEVVWLCKSHHATADKLRREREQELVGA